MLRQVSLVVLLLVAAVLALDADGPAAASKVLVASGKPTSQIVNPGILICEGGQPTGLAAPMCSPGTTKILIRNLIQEGAYQDLTGTAAAIFRGKFTAVTQCNLDDKYYGFCWGTFEWAVPEMGGKFEGSWSGVLDYAIHAGYLSGNAYGYGGKLEGLRMTFDELYPGGTAPWVGILKVLPQ
ncbi:MAG: hypothetical protein FJW34_10840 [Acidobacteria bacterium]|nr:hypothetical protein [Acidobacteriota bacterium]